VNVGGRVRRPVGQLVLGGLLVDAKKRLNPSLTAEPE
jgi:hypothetical protein